MRKAPRTYAVKYGGKTYVIYQHGYGLMRSRKLVHSLIGASIHATTPSEKERREGVESNPRLAKRIYRVVEVFDEHTRVAKNDGDHVRSFDMCNRIVWVAMYVYFSLSFMKNYPNLFYRICELNAPSTANPLSSTLSQAACCLTSMTASIPSSPFPDISSPHLLTLPRPTHRIYHRLSHTHRLPRPPPGHPPPDYSHWASTPAVLYMLYPESESRIDSGIN